MPESETDERSDGVRRVNGNRFSRGHVRPMPITGLGYRFWKQPVVVIRLWPGIAVENNGRQI